MIRLGKSRTLTLIDVVAQDLTLIALFKFLIRFKT